MLSLNENFYYFKSFDLLQSHVHALSVHEVAADWDAETRDAAASSCDENAPQLLENGRIRDDAHVKKMFRCHGNVEDAGTHLSGSV